MSQAALDALDLRQHMTDVCNEARSQRSGASHGLVAKGAERAQALNDDGTEEDGPKHSLHLPYDACRMLRQVL